MGAYKNKNNGTWIVQNRYKDWQGQTQQVYKRGFATKKEALAWEREFLLKTTSDVNMTFESFYERYRDDIKPRIKLSDFC